MAWYSNQFSLCKSPKCSATTMVTLAHNLRFGLCRLQSPLLTASLLLYFPPLSKMLQFSGYSSLTSGRWLWCYDYYVAIFIHHCRVFHSMVQACHMYAIFYGSVLETRRQDAHTHTHRILVTRACMHDTHTHNDMVG